MFCWLPLHNNVNQPQVHTYPLAPGSPSCSTSSHPSTKSQSTRLISLFYTATSHQLSFFNLKLFFQICADFSASILISIVIKATNLLILLDQSVPLSCKSSVCFFPLSWCFSPGCLICSDVQLYLPSSVMLLTVVLIFCI